MHRPPVATTLQHWNIGTIKRITQLTSGIDHFNFLIKTKQKKYVLSFLRPEEKKYLQQQNNLAQLFSTVGLTIPTPILTIHNKPFITTKTAIVILTQYLQGKHIDPPIPEQLLLEFGKRLAQIHTLFQNYPSKQGESWITWTQHNNILSQINKKTPSLYQKLKTISTITKKNLTPLLKKCPLSVVHGDFHPWNVLITKSTITAVLDFYDLHSDYRIWDLAVTLAHCCGEESHILPQSVQPIVTGYTSIIKLTYHEQQALYWLILYRCFEIIRWALEQTNDKHTPKPAPLTAYQGLHKKWLLRAQAWQKLGKKIFDELTTQTL